MKRFAAVIISLAVLAGPVSAGRKETWKVVVDTPNKVAYGSLGSARNSSDSVQSIGCSVFYDTANSRNQVSCQATTAAGVTAQCGSQDPNLVQVALAIHSNSYVQFRWNAGECTTIFVSNTSALAPAAP